MNHKFALLTALVAGLLPVSAVAQVSSAPPPQSAPATPDAQPAAPAIPPAAPAAQPAPVVPQAIPAKIALIAFEQAVIATNEGQRTVQELQKKYEPKKAQIDALGAEVDSLKKQVNAAPSTLTEADRASRLRTIDAKEKQLNLDTESATNAYQADLQEAYSKVAQKVHVVMATYLTQNGYTMALDVSNQQSPVTWALETTDVTEAVIAAYNSSSGITAPPPAAPSATRPKPAATTPHSTTTPHTTTTPKPPTQ